MTDQMDHSAVSIIDPCNVFLDEFKDAFSLSLADACPVCFIPGGRHHRRPTGLADSNSNAPTGSASASVGSKDTFNAVSNSFIKISKLLPRYSKASDIRNFVKKLDLILRTNEGIPKDKWCRVFLYVFDESDQSSLEWVMKNIVDTDSGELSWNEATRVFTAHFERAEYKNLLMQKFHKCRQHPNESVQSYGDRFTDVVNELEREDDDVFVLDKFLFGLNKEIRQKFEEYLSLERVKEDNISYQVSSLEKLIKICIIFDVAGKSAFTSGTRSNSEGEVQRKTGNHHSVKSKYCAIHKAHGHSTVECYSNRDRSNSSKAPSGYATRPSGTSYTPGPGPKDVSKIQCYKCKAFGHYATACTNSGVTTSSSSSSSATGTAASSASYGVRSSRPSVPPQRLTYNAPGRPVEEKGSESKSVNLVHTDHSFGSDGPNRSPVLPDRVWLFDPVSHRTISTLVDTGANVSCIDTKLARDLKVAFTPMEGVIHLAGKESSVPRIGVTDATTFSALFVMSASPELITRKFTHRFEIMDLETDKQQVVLGRDVLGQLFPHGMPLGFYGAVARDPSRTDSAPALCGIRVIQPDAIIENSKNVNHIQLLDEMSDADSEAVPLEEVRERTSVSTPLSLESEYAEHRNKMMNDPDVRSAIAVNESISGFCSLPESIVHLNVDPEYQRTGYRKQYSVPEAARPAVDEQVDKWLKAGKIELAPLNCPFNSSLVVACKKDAHGNFTGYRICLDTRVLNKHLVEVDRFQLPAIHDVLEQFADCMFFGELDLSEAYLQFQLDEASRPLTAFTWAGKQYVFVGAPFGISLLPSYFQRVMSNTFNNLAFTIPYIDNLPFGSRSAAEHRTHLLLLLNRCNEHNLKVKVSAMKVAHAQMHCLGHLLTRSGVALSPSKLAFVAAAERPVTGKQLQSFLGVVTFLRSNIRHMSELTASLDAVKNVPGELHWTDRMIQDFDVLKQAIATAPALAYPDYTKPFHIATDASNVGVGAVLYQPDSDEGDITATNIVALVSKKLNGASLNYSAYKKELYAIVQALRKFHPYVWGRNDLVIHTDHRPLTHMFKQRELSPALQQYLDVLLDYHFTIRYRPGILNVLPDHLSRLYAAEYADSSAWGVPNKMPWKVVGEPDPGPNQDSESRSEEQMEMGSSISPTVAAVTIEDVTDVQSDAPVAAANNDGMAANPEAEGGGNAVALNMNAEEQLAEAILLLEQRGFKIPPASDRVELIQTTHEFGHFGVDAICRSLISRQLWWKGMRKDVLAAIAHCDPCNRFTVVKSGFNPAQYITSTAPMEHIQLDTSVHLPTAPGGYTTLLVVIDVFTAFVILRALKSSTAEVVANELWSIFCLLGVPKIIQSDNGSEFTNHVIRTLVQLIGSQHRFISPYNPRSDGKVERSIRTTMSIIKKLIHGNEREWPIFVPFAQLAFNNKVASLTGSSPFSLMFGRSLNPFVDYTETDPNSDDASSESTGISIDLEHWKTHMEKVQSLIYPAILERTLDGKSKMIKRLDAHRRVLTENAFPNGAIVMIRDPHRTDKFQPKYIGPYSIVRRTRAGTFVVRDSTGAMLDRHVPVDQLKLISKKPRAVDLNTMSYVVEKVIGHRGTPGSYEYETKFQGYPVPEWIPEENFADTQAIRAYWDQRNQQGNTGERR